MNIVGFCKLQHKIRFHAKAAPCHPQGSVGDSGKTRIEQQHGSQEVGEDQSTVRAKIKFNIFYNYPGLRNGMNVRPLELSRRCCC